MTSFDMLSAPIRKYIYDKGWGSLRPIQEAAIQRIIPTDNNYVLISRTASGKTEAAFLPILSKVNFREQGVKVLYISPLIALINDQFIRVEKLCEYLDVPVTKWHGEAAKGAKEKLLKHPEGIVLITPESLEAMFVNKPYQIKHLFANLEYVVIDEIHSFLGSARGTHLQSLLSRLQNINSRKFCIVGLSATVSDVNRYIELKEFLGDPENTKIIRDKTPKPINAVFRYFASTSPNLSSDLLNDVYVSTKNSKTLIFPNARGRVEEVAVGLKKISDRLGGHQNYFSHHSSVDKEVREYVEFFAKNSSVQNFCISCTSTLELGIDIGNVDEVVQIDATHSIASLIQRVGRSGRREDRASNLFLYATDPWSLLQSVACWLLYQEQYIEPVSVNKKPYDVLLHQTLSIVKAHSGMMFSELLEEICANSSFSRIEKNDIEAIIRHLAKTDLLEKIGNEYIIGIEGEKLVNNKDFYSLFQTPVLFKVSCQGVKIGELPLSSQVRIDENVYLSARIWKIQDIDYETKKIEVIPARDGKKPIFSGDPADTVHKIREKMLEIILSEDQYDFLDAAGHETIRELRKYFSVFEVKNPETDRIVHHGQTNSTFYTFTSSKIHRTLSFMMDSFGIEHQIHDSSSSMSIKSTDGDFAGVLQGIHLDEITIVQMLEQLIQEKPAMLDFSKWAKYLPLRYQAKLLKESYFDFEGCHSFLKNLNFVEN